MKSIASAIQFLTVFPMGLETDEKDLGRSIAWFPIAGLCIGGISAFLYWLAIRMNLSTDLSSALAVLFLAVFSGGLHLDGLADSADGLFSHRSRERTLEIMKDSRIGTMGVLALVFILLVKCLVLSSLLPRQAFLILFLAPCASRAAMSVSVALFPYAREDGLAKVFMRFRHPADCLIPILMAMVTGWFCMRAFGIIIAVIPILSGLAISCYSWRKIGGITGDVLGAISEVGETVSFLAAVLICSNFIF